MKDLKGKVVIGWDTICDGNQCVKDENDIPVLYDSKDEAVKEMFGDAISSLNGTDDDYFTENDLDKESLIDEMEEILESGDVARMEQFFSDNPSANYNDEFVEDAETFVLGRKAIFTGDGGTIEGTLLKDL